jgi:hypothetical protein
MATPADRFSNAAARAEEGLLPLRLPPVIALAQVPSSPAGPAQAIAEADLVPVSPQGQPYGGDDAPCAGAARGAEAEEAPNTISGQRTAP